MLLLNSRDGALILWVILLVVGQFETQSNKLLLGRSSIQCLTQNAMTIPGCCCCCCCLNHNGVMLATSAIGKKAWECSSKLLRRHFRVALKFYGRNVTTSPYFSCKSTGETFKFQESSLILMTSGVE